MPQRQRFSGADWGRNNLWQHTGVEVSEADRQLAVFCSHSDLTWPSFPKRQYQTAHGQDRQRFPAAASSQPNSMGKHIRPIGILSKICGTSWAEQFTSTICTYFCITNGRAFPAWYLGHRMLVCDYGAWHGFRPMTDTNFMDCFCLWCNFSDFGKRRWCHSNSTFLGNLLFDVYSNVLIHYYCLGVFRHQTASTFRNWSIIFSE